MNIDFGLFSDNTYDIKPDIDVQTNGVDVMIGCSDKGTLLFYRNKGLWVTKVSVASPFDFNNSKRILLLSNNIYFSPTKAIIAF